MMKWMPAAWVALTLTACSSNTQPVYYQIPVANSAAGAQMQSASGEREAIWVDQVTVPDYLAGNGVVYQTSEVKYVIATSNLWASPLDQQLKQALVSNLSAQLPGRVVAATPFGSHPDRLYVNVTGFQGRYDGKAIISGDWTLQQGDALTRRSFMLTLPQSEDGYDALVKTLGQGWQQVAGEVAQQAAKTVLLKSN